MSPDERTALYRRAIAHFGANHQTTKAIEELCECAATLARVGNGLTEPWRYEVLAEIADAEIMLEQLRLIIGDDLIEAAKRQKLYRLRERIEKE